MVVILALLGAVAVATCVWCGHHVRRETLRRRQVDRVRAALAGKTSVAELRERCGADSLARFPAPRAAVTAPDPAAARGSISERAA
ncbi:hypothetical protein [Lentzea flaviverrucosa]|uniref:hypothetical protein n=1 Tax=Lentzea flaviverrucosa TaxID=200379 RepID=UPI000B7EA80E|nr:hypothetical protein [Lentzea flaviverrucosa]